MDDFSRDLADLLTVRKHGDDFIGDTEPYGIPDRLYGGHFLAQSLRYKKNNRYVVCGREVSIGMLFGNLFAYSK